MFYVLNESGWPSYADVDDDDGEMFDNRNAAEARAKVLADENPGEIFFIVKVLAEVACSINAPSVSERE
ncbi:MAG: hypothetical protein KGL35_30095 [Bradyrhizobium sp.]|nr:hypothetical protein [Bradyrhizobium sp.]